MLLRACATAVLTLLLACSAEQRTAPASLHTTGAAGGLRTTTFAAGLEHPWSLAWLPDGQLLVTERPGRLRRISADGRVLSPPLAGVPAVDARGSGGLLEVLPAPDFAATRRIYLSYSEPGQGAESGRNGLAVARARLAADGNGLDSVDVIFRQQPKVASGAHHGGRLAWGRDGTLFVTTGERQAASERDKAQDLGSGHGKILRLLPDGRVPPDNPFVGIAGALPAVWSYGHRNPQGLVLQPGSGDLWALEHGPQGGDELNRVLPGRNYGWPRVSHGCEYGAPVGRCVPVGGASAAPGVEPPVAFWEPMSIAPSGAAFHSGRGFPEWRGDLFVGALAGQALWRLRLDGGRVVEREPLLMSLRERIRDVREGPDGWLYLLTDHRDGRVLRLER